MFKHKLRLSPTSLCFVTDLMVMGHYILTGQAVKPPSSGDIVTGDRIKCEVNLAELDDPEMAEKIGLVRDSFNLWHY